MASAFAHALSAYAIGKVFPKVLMRKSVLALGILSAVMPDADVIGFNYGIPYEHVLGHRGITHSIFFAVVWASLLLLIFHRRDLKKDKNVLFAYYFIATVSHGLLDGLTNGGEGVAYFAPFMNERMFLPWELIKVSPLSIKRFFSEWGLKVIMSEMIWIGIPSMILIAVGYYKNRSKT